MAIFKKKHMDLVLAERKTQTRRIHKYEWKVGKKYHVRARWFDKGVAKILIVRKFRQRLGDISPRDIQKEGYTCLEDYKKAWIEINGQWDPDTIVIVYEFKLVSKTSKPSTAGENHKSGSEPQVSPNSHS